MHHLRSLLAVLLLASVTVATPSVRATTAAARHPARGHDRPRAGPRAGGRHVRRLRVRRASRRQTLVGARLDPRLRVRPQRAPGHLRHGRARRRDRAPHITDARRATIDLEPNSPSWGAQNVHILDNEVGPGRLLFVAAAGRGPVAQVVVARNRLRGHILNMSVQPPGTDRRSGFYVVDNMSDTPASRSPPHLHARRRGGRAGEHATDGPTRRGGRGGDRRVRAGRGQQRPEPRNPAASGATSRSA